MHSYKIGKHVYLAFDDDVRELLHYIINVDSDEQNVFMTKITNKIRNDIFLNKKIPIP